MSKQIVVTPFGIYSSEGGKLSLESEFSASPAEAAKKLREYEKTETLPELDSLLESGAEFSADSEASIDARLRLDELAKERGIEAKKYIHALNQELTKLRMHEELSSPDRRIIQAVNSLEEMDPLVNVLSERLREWSSLYSPELSRSVQKHDDFLIKLSQQKEVSSELGAVFERADTEVPKDIAHSLSDMYETRTKLREYLEKMMKEHYPNLEAVAGSHIGAQLMALAGGAKRLATKPSSTVQVLGAEKALFRHVTTGAKPPKYGVLLHHPVIKDLPKHLRGKGARILAGKISLAIRADFYGSGFSADKLNESLDKRIKNLK
ncbi:TPA: hypothetical protein H1008_02915 [archaeon]|nr:hypothetical protein [Candidatus Undinarchaeales archaeon SRR5007147.bin71]